MRINLFRAPIGHLRLEQENELRPFVIGIGDVPVAVVYSTFKRLRYCCETLKVGLTAAR